MEIAILDFIRESITSPFLDPLMVFITRLGDAGFIWIIAGLVLMCFKKHRKMGIMVMASLACCLIIGNITLKPLIARIRPFDAVSVGLIIPPPHDFSFPSGHTLASFAAATMIFLHRKKGGVAALILAGLIGFSRLYLYVHYPSDVLGGMILGIGISLFLYYLAKRLNFLRKME